MSRSLNKQQKDKVSQFVSITGADQRVAVECLQLGSWNVEAAIDYFYSSGLSSMASLRSGGRLDRDAIHKLYLRYKDPDSDQILAEGIAKLCEDLGVEPDDIVMLVLSWHFKAAAMYEYSREEFEEGLTKLGVDSLDKLKAKLPSLRAEMDSPDKFRQIYNFAYLFSREKGQKCVHLDVGVAMWQLLVPPSRWQHIGAWCEFLTEHHKRAISRDTWTQLLDFMQNVKPDFSNYDDAGAWPYLLDEFVEQMRAQHLQASNHSDRMQE